MKARAVRLWVGVFLLVATCGVSVGRIAAPQPFENSLGIKFVTAPGAMVLFSAWNT
jgi:hypothetical protein